MRVLLVENNSRLAMSIITNLKAEGIRTELAETGQNALYLLKDYDFDIVLLNLLLSDPDGSSLVSGIRAARHDTPIIAVSTNSHARLRALSAGADDVVERDIDRAELVARIRAVVRRSRGFAQSRLQIGKLTLDVEENDVAADGVRVHFTGKEFAVLQHLVLRRNMIMTKEMILAHLYGGMDAPEIKIIDVFVCKIRGKLAKAGLPSLISTVWGRGYIVKDFGHERSAVAPALPQPAQKEQIFA